MKFDLRRLLEGAILGNFVSQQVMQVGEMQPSLALDVQSVVIDAISKRLGIQTSVRSMFKQLSWMQSPASGNPTSNATVLSLSGFAPQSSGMLVSRRRPVCS